MHGLKCRHSLRSAAARTHPSGLIAVRVPLRRPVPLADWPQTALGRNRAGAAMLRAHAPGALADLAAAVGTAAGVPACRHWRTPMILPCAADVPESRGFACVFIGADSEFRVASLHAVAGVLESAAAEGSSFSERLAMTIEGTPGAYDTPLILEIQRGTDLKSPYCLLRAYA